MSISSFLSNYQYADLRIERGRELVAKITEEETRISDSEYFLCSARVLINGSWGFATSNNPEVKLNSIIEKAASLARLEKARVVLARSGRERVATKKSKARTENDDEIKGLKEGAKEIKGRHIKNKTVSCRDWSVEKEFYNSEGSEITGSFNRVFLSCTAIAKSGSLIQRGHETDASITGFDDIDVVGTARKAGEKAERYLFAEPPPKGRFVVVLDSEMTGVFSHEAVGHACEADSVIERESILRGKIGMRIGSKLVTIIDDPISKHFGHYSYDDEGVQAQHVTLVKNGILKNYINSRETAHKLKTKPNGHCRAQDAASIPIVRMSNTFMLSGRSKKDELFDINQGIYVKGMSGGSVDIFSGSFMFKAEEAYEIKNGAKEKLLRDITLSGNILETLKLVEMVADDFGTSPGVCGKFGQGVPVSDGGPHIRVSDMKIG